MHTYHLMNKYIYTDHGYRPKEYGTTIVPTKGILSGFDNLIRFLVFA
jgi:hypothetical protein